MQVLLAYLLLLLILVPTALVSWFHLTPAQPRVVLKLLVGRLTTPCALIATWPSILRNNRAEAWHSHHSLLVISFSAGFYLRFCFI